MFALIFEPGFVATVVLALLGGIIWNVRLEGRVNGHDTLFIEREKLVTERYEELQARLGRIEDKLDRHFNNYGNPRN